MIGETFRNIYECFGKNHTTLRANGYYDASIFSLSSFVFRYFAYTVTLTAVLFSHKLPFRYIVFQYFAARFLAFVIFKKSGTLYRIFSLRYLASHVLSHQCFVFTALPFQFRFLIFHPFDILLSVYCPSIFRVFAILPFPVMHVRIFAI